MKNLYIILAVILVSCNKKEPVVIQPHQYEIKYTITGGNYFFNHYNLTSEAYTSMVKGQGYREIKYSGLEWSFAAIEAIPDSNSTVIINIYIDGQSCGTDQMEYGEIGVAKVECES